MYGGDVYDSSHIPGGNYPGLGSLSTQYGYNATNTLNTWVATTDGASPSTITVTFVNSSTGTPQPHGLFPGATIAVAGTNSFDGDYIINAVPNMSTIKFTTYSTYPSITVGSAGRIITKSDGYIIHRPYDAGVALTTYNNVPGLRTIRQTRRYFRYQSGKGIQFSTGTSLCPSLIVSGITSSGTTATVTSRFAHNLAVGCTVVITGADQGAYNGTFTIATVPTPTTFTYTMSAAPGVSPATGQVFRVNPTNWYGSSNRVGFFDQQNGMFFEYDGQTLYAVWRNSTTQISGTVAVTQNSSAVTGTSTQFTTQLAPEIGRAHV